MDNEAIANVLSQVADLLEIEGASTFRVRAYRGAARTVGALASPAGSLPEKGTGSLEELPGIGKDLAGKIRELAETGELALLHELKERTPESLIHLLELPGLGPKRAKAIYEGLGIDTIDELEKAAREGRLRALKGVGPKLEAQILEGILARAARGKRILLAQAEAEIEPIVRRLREAPGVSRIEVAGSYRRRRDNVGDVDILVAADVSSGIGKLLIADGATEKVLADGETKTSVVLKSGLQVDLRVVPAESFGAALHYFTGSKAHNIAIRTLGVRKKLKINEYGVFQDSTRLSGEREEDVFASVGLAFVPPELREDRGEIDAAREGRLPKLCDAGDLRGDVVEAPEDGAALVALIEAARARYSEFVVVLGPREITEPGGGARREQFFATLEEAKKQTRGMKILAGATVGIREDGTLDADEKALAELDIVRAEVPNARGVPEKALTQRLVAALESGRVNVLARPTGVFPKDKPAQVDAEAIAKAVKARGALLELDARPERLAGADGFSRAAKDSGAKLLLASHASNASELDRIRYGLDHARRGWCEAKDIANTLDADALTRPA
jgi:DNA polymerase (family X)